MHGMSGSNGPLFVLATRLYVHYKFKTRTSIDLRSAINDDDYARDVLRRARAIPDRKMQDLADRFEAVRFPAAAPPGLVIDLPLDGAGQA